MVPLGMIDSGLLWTDAETLAIAIRKEYADASLPTV
jgi:hypothetical protein